MSLGLRADYFEQSLKRRTFRRLDAIQAVEEVDIVEENDPSGTFELSPNINLIYKPKDNLTFYAGYSESFVPNGIFTNFVTMETKTIDPTEGEQFEIGFKGEFLDEKLFINASIFDVTRTNIFTGREAGTGDAIFSDGINTKGFELDRR